jgi:lysozyme family protein
MANFDISVTRVLEKEGGYQSNKKDRGNYVTQQGNWAHGKYPFTSNDGSKLLLIGTNKGITAPGFYDYLGRLPTVAEMKNISDATVKDIYKQKYWIPIKGDLINNQAVSDILLDGAVNQGVGYMSRALQRILKVVVDGNIGNITIAALNKTNQGALYVAIKNNRKARYREIAKQPGQNDFLDGWITRVNSFKDYISNSLADNNNTDGKNNAVIGGIIAISFFFLVKPFLSK